MKSPHLCLLLLCALALAACTPGAAEPTPTPEIFIPLNPSPTPSSSTLPLTCQVTDLPVYINEAEGYCLAYPAGFTPEDAAGELRLLGPALDTGAEPLRASLSVEARAVPAGSDLARLADAFLALPDNQNPPQPIERAALMLGGEAAVRLEGVPGQFSSRVVLALHGETLLTLRFQPTDAAPAQADLEALYQTATGSFAFLAEGPQAQAGTQTLSWFEFGQTFNLEYAEALAPWAAARTVAQVPMDGGLWAEAHPAYAQFGFWGWQGGRAYDLPLLPFDDRAAQVKIFATVDFAGYDVGDYRGFEAQQQRLAELLAGGLDPAVCAAPLAEPDAGLPMLPWLYAQQVFCAQPQVVAFDGGQGVRYLTFYAQDDSPALEQQVFYTFQGLSTDGRYYIAAFFPVETGLFPTEPPAGLPVPNPNYLATLSEQVQRLNALPGDSLRPTLATLDSLVASLSIRP